MLPRITPEAVALFRQIQGMRRGDKRTELAWRLHGLLALAPWDPRPSEIENDRDCDCLGHRLRRELQAAAKAEKRIAKAAGLADGASK